MNRRKKKKLRKKQELFAISFASSYREVKELDRSYHEFVLKSQRMQRCGHHLLDNIEWDGETNSWKKTLEQHNVKPADTFEF